MRMNKRNWTRKTNKKKIVQKKKFGYTPSHSDIKKWKNLKRDDPKEYEKQRKQSKHIGSEEKNTKRNSLIQIYKKYGLGSKDGRSNLTKYELVELKELVRLEKENPVEFNKKVNNRKYWKEKNKAWNMQKTIDIKKVMAIDPGYGNFVIATFLISDEDKNFRMYFNSHLGDLSSIAERIETLNRERNKVVELKDNLNINNNLQKIESKLKVLKELRKEKLWNIHNQIANKLIKISSGNKINKIIMGYSEDNYRIISRKREMDPSYLSNNKNENSFLNLPLHDFYEVMEKRAKLEGIKFIKTEEVETSEVDFVTLEPFGTEMKKGYRDKRVFSVGERTCDSDINGAYNIARKIYLNEINDLEEKERIFLVNKEIIEFSL